MWSDFLKKLADTGIQCVYCGREIAAGALVCADCAWEEEALENKDGFAGGILFAYRYDGAVRALVHDFKYNDMPRLAPFIAQRMADFLAHYELGADVVTFVPIHERRMKTRGYDQSELIAYHLGVLLGLPCEKMLARVRETKPQYKLSAQERRQNVRGAFAAAEGAHLKGKNILLIDDIFTTGATVGECMKVLADAGGNVMVFAYTKEFPKRKK